MSDSPDASQNLETLAAVLERELTTIADSRGGFVATPPQDASAPVDKRLATSPRSATAVDPVHWFLERTRLTERERSVLLGRLVDALYTLRAVGTKLSRSGERVRQMLAKIRRKADAAASRAGNDFPLFEEREMLRAVFEACGCVDLDALSSMRPSVADLCTLEQLVFFCGRGGRIVNNAGVRYLFRDQRSGLEALARCASFAPSEVESTSATLGGTSGEMFRRQCVRARARAMRGRRG